MVEQHFCLRWNNYRTNITAEFETLREGEHFVDVTLACDGRQLKAHKVVLSACSPYFKELLQGNPCSHPIIILKDVVYSHMRGLLEFMYAGEVNVSQADLPSFLHTAETLKIRGLAESKPDERDGAGNTRNSLSPLSALKNSLGTFGGISLGGLPLMPQLLPHPGEPPPTSNSQPSTPNLIPSTLPLPCTSYNSSVKVSSPDRVPSDPQGPIPLTVNTHSNDLGNSNRHKGDGERKEPSSPLSLPPNKRIRSERKMLGHTHLKNSHGGKKTPDKAPNGCSYPSLSGSNSILSSNDTVTSKLGITTSHGTEEIPDAIPKVEPQDPPVSDTEGSVGWPEEGECSGLGGDSYPSPEPSSSHNALSGMGSTSADSENPSHLVQTMSEPHLPGDGGTASKSSTPSGPAPSREVPRSCPYCAKLISNFYNLKKHITTMHQAPTFYHACCHCSATFRTPEYLRKHLVNVHKYPVKKKK